MAPRSNSNANVNGEVGIIYNHPNEDTVLHMENSSKFRSSFVFANFKYPPTKYQIPRLPTIDEALHWAEGVAYDREEVLNIYNGNPDGPSIFGAIMIRGLKQ